LKAEQDGGGGTARLSWKAAPGSQISYVIERSGPGLTFFTQIAGPISETTLSVDTMAPAGERGAFVFRVRAIDAAGNKSPFSNSVSVPAMVVTKPLPLVGNDVLALLTTLPGYNALWRDVGPVTPDSGAVIFKHSPDGSTVTATCRAAKCEVITAGQIEVVNGTLRATGDVERRQLTLDQVTTIPASLSFIVVNPR
jgi:hypothetical protein